MDAHCDQMLSFPGELAFLLRTFFFVLVGMLVDYVGLRKNTMRPFCVPLCFGGLGDWYTGRPPRLVHSFLVL